MTTPAGILGSTSYGYSVPVPLPSEPESPIATLAQVIASGNDSDLTEYTTASFAVVSGDTYLVSFTARGVSGEPPDITMTNTHSGSWSWTRVQQNEAANHCTVVFYAVAPASSSGTVKFTNTLDPATMNRGRWIVTRIEDTSGIINTHGESNTSDTVKIFLPDLPYYNSVVIGVMGAAGDYDGVLPGSARFTELSEGSGVSAERTTLQVQYDNNAPKRDVLWAGLGTVGSNYIVLEVKALSPQVPPVSTAPTAVNDQFTNLTPSTLVNLPVLQNDIAGTNPIDVTTVAITAVPTGGTATAQANGTVNYTPNGGTTNDAFSYSVRDNQNILSNIGTVNLTVKASGGAGKPATYSGITNRSDSGTGWLSDVQKIAVWRNLPIDISTIFTGAKGITWNNLVATNDGYWTTIRVCAQNGIIPIISLPVNQVGDATGNFTNVNNGNYDAAITNCALRIKAALTIGGVVKQCVLRPGWETSAIGGPWEMKGIGSGNVYTRFANWRTAFNRVVQRMKAEIPTAWVDLCHQKDFYNHFLTDSPGTSEYDMLQALNPGIDSSGAMDRLTHITIDNYDSYPIAGTPDGVSYNSWRVKYDRVFNYAASISKKTGIDEWGCRTKLADGGCDNPIMIQWIHDLVSSTPHCEWEVYFRINKTFNIEEDAVHSICWIDGSGNVRNNTPWNGRRGNFVGSSSASATSNASNKYRELWGGV